MPPVQAILWDNDGVLVDTEKLYYRATAQIMAQKGFELTEALFKEYFLVQNIGAWHLLDAQGVSAGEIPALKEQRSERYLELLRSEDISLPGVREAVSKLHGRCRMCIVTSSHKNHFDAIHERTGLLEFFEFALCRQHYERSKPYPDPYLAALDKLGLPAEACLVIEDSERGLRAARAAGIRCWAIPTELSKESDFSGADKIVESIEEAAALLLSMSTHVPL